jgi:amino acid adenylation domain-containing protein
MQHRKCGDLSDGRTVQSIFESTAKRHPNSPAVYNADGECWSYSRLNSFSNQIAHRLLATGIVPEQRVGVCMKRSPETVGVLLGILKARACYVPLDVNLPPERLRYIAADAMAQQIFVDSAGRQKLQIADVHDMELLNAAANTGMPDRLPDLPWSSRGLANILYTSGSTGKPKGAMLEHRGVLRLVVDATWLKFSSDDVVLQMSALSFDLSTFEIWGPLLNGGCLVTVSETPALWEIGQLVEKFKVTTMWLTAGLFNVLMEEQPEAIRSLKHLLTGGDIASPRHARRALMHLKRGELLNCYGPTENATFSTCHRVKLSDTERPSIPIGRPVDKSPVYLLNDSLKPVEDHGTGEIFAGGEGLSRGYWNRPELTAERFLDVEIAPGVVERLYRTGDLGRYNESGLLEFVGRTDFQVKIRGFRIEPEEIELALSAMPGLASASVIATGAAADSKELCCFFVRDKTIEITPEAIKSFLAARLPDYMIPSVFREFPCLPLNANNKIDRKALSIAHDTARHTRTDRQDDRQEVLSGPSAADKFIADTSRLQSEPGERSATLPQSQSGSIFALISKAFHKVTAAFHRVSALHTPRTTDMQRVQTK